MNKSDEALAYGVGITSFASFLITFSTIINLSNVASHAVVVDSNSLTTLYIGVFLLPESLVALILTAKVLTILKKIAKNYFKFRLYLILFLVCFILVGIYLTIMIQWHTVSRYRIEQIAWGLVLVDAIESLLLGIFPLE